MDFIILYKIKDFSNFLMITLILKYYINFNKSQVNLNFKYFILFLTWFYNTKVHFSSFLSLASSSPLLLPPSPFPSPWYVLFLLMCFVFFVGFFFCYSSSPFFLCAFQLFFFCPFYCYQMKNIFFLNCADLQSSSPRTESPMEILNDAFLSDLEKFRSISKIQH